MTDDCELCRLRAEAELLTGVVATKEALLQMVERALAGEYFDSGLAGAVKKLKRTLDQTDAELGRMRKRAEGAERAYSALASGRARFEGETELIARAEKAEALLATADKQLAAMLDDTTKGWARVRELEVDLDDTGRKLGRVLADLSASNARFPELHARLHDQANAIRNGTAIRESVEKILDESRQRNRELEAERDHLNDVIGNLSVRVLRYEAAIDTARDVLRPDDSPERRRAWHDTVQHLRRKAGLDEPKARKVTLAEARESALATMREAEERRAKYAEDDAQLADLLREAGRHCRDCRNCVQGLPNAQCDGCSFPERTNFAAKEAERGPKGAISMPIGTCEGCGRHDVETFRCEPRNGDARYLCRRCDCDPTQFAMAAEMLAHVRKRAAERGPKPVYGWRMDSLYGTGTWRRKYGDLMAYVGKHPFPALMGVKDSDYSWCILDGEPRVVGSGLAKDEASAKCAADAKLAELVADRGPKGDNAECSVCGTKENVFGGMCQWCAAKQRAKDRGPKGEPGKPAVMWKCPQCTHWYEDRPEFHESAMHFGCVGRVIRHVWREGKWVKESAK